MEPEKLDDIEQKKNSVKLPGDEEPTDSSLTHDEIRQWVAKYHITW